MKIGQFGLTISQDNAIWQLHFCRFVAFDKEKPDNLCVLFDRQNIWRRQPFHIKVVAGSVLFKYNKNIAMRI